MGHSSFFAAADMVLIIHSFCSGVIPEKPCLIPDLDFDGRISYIAIARRAAAESVHFYSLLSVGASAFIRAKKIEANSNEEDT